MSQAPLSLSPEQCRGRQSWLVQLLRRQELEAALLVRPEHVQYFTGHRPHYLMSTAVLLDREGRCTLVASGKPEQQNAVDEVIPFEAQWHCTLRMEQVQSAAMALCSAMPAAGSLGVEMSSFPLYYDARFSKQGLVTQETRLVDIEPELWQRRRQKDADELAMIRRAIDCTEAMYQRARSVIEPGITELEVFSELHAAAVEVAGEPLTALGNDYQCNSPGGLPRRRAAQAGELFILDLGPAYRGYYADNCRTFAVTTASSEQQRAWQAIVDCLDMVESTVKPGVSCRTVFDKAQAMLDAYRPGSFAHHLGHGIGLFPHEAPHLNPHWDDTFQEGEVFTAEPGLYGPDLKAGIRLEQNYLVTATGVERLTQHPLELT